LKKRNKAVISFNMSRIRSSGSVIENVLGKAMWKAGLRYRKQYKRIPGRPDFVLVKHKIAIFCDSSFWHGYKSMATSLHDFKSNKNFWITKIKRNMERDREVNRHLKKLGWEVYRFWDFQIINKTDKCVKKILQAKNQKL
jgi:DNA mismatch endonuclease, patch repair protein